MTKKIDFIMIMFDFVCVSVVCALKCMNGILPLLNCKPLWDQILCLHKVEIQ